MISRPLVILMQRKVHLNQLVKWFQLIYWTASMLWPLLLRIWLTPVAMTIPGFYLRVWLWSPTPDRVRVTVSTVTWRSTLLEHTVQWSAASTLPGSLLKRQISVSHLQPMISECLGVRPRCPCFSKFSRWFISTLRFENKWSRNLLLSGSLPKSQIPRPFK